MSKSKTLIKVLLPMLCLGLYAGLAYGVEATPSAKSESYQKKPSLGIPEEVKTKIITQYSKNPIPESEKNDKNLNKRITQNEDNSLNMTEVLLKFEKEQREEQKTLRGRGKNSDNEASTAFSLK